MNHTPKPSPPNGHEIITWEELPNIVRAGFLYFDPWNLKWFPLEGVGVEKIRVIKGFWFAAPVEKINGQASNDPKGEIGKTKPPMWLLPATALIETAWAMGNGAERYGPYNWRETKVCASTYISAMMRHWAAYLDGEDIAQDSKAQHLAHIAANCNILMDAAKCGTLIDDRPKHHAI